MDELYNFVSKSNKEEKDYTLTFNRILLTIDVNVQNIQYRTNNESNCIQEKR